DAGLIRLDDRLAARRLGERRVQVRVQVVDGLEPEQPALPARVGRLQHRRDADGLDRRSSLEQRAHAGERGLRDAVLGEQGAPRAISVSLPPSPSTIWYRLSLDVSLSGPFVP